MPVLVIKVGWDAGLSGRVDITSSQRQAGSRYLRKRVGELGWDSTCHLSSSAVPAGDHKWFK